MPDLLDKLNFRNSKCVKDLDTKDKQFLTSIAKSAVIINTWILFIVNFVIYIIFILQCITDCMYKELGFINNNGFDKVVFEEYIKSKLNHTSFAPWTQIFIDNFNNCADKGKTSKIMIFYENI